MSSLAVLLAADTFGWPARLPGVDATSAGAAVATTLLQATGPLWTNVRAAPAGARNRMTRRNGARTLRSPSEPLTLGVELELQLVSTHDFDLDAAGRRPAARAAQHTPLPGT